mgnify:CR=1 FL=1
MARYRAKKMGTLPDGRRVREGAEFEFAGKPGAWMEEIEANASGAESAPPAPDEKPADAKAGDAEPDSAVEAAAPKRAKRKGAE